jgi:hypothetical protein
MPHPGQQLLDARHEAAERMLAKRKGVMSEDERQAVGNVVVYGFVPQWFYAAWLRSQIMPEDEAGAPP